MRGCKNKDNSTVATTDSTATTNSTPATTDSTPVASTDTSGNWNNINFDAATATYGEITDSNITVRGNSDYGIYGLGENILFDEGKSSIKPTAEANLKQIAASIAQRYKNASVRVYGYTDAIGSAGYNKELAQQRAQAVSDWLVANGNIGKDKISINAVGEERPVASNATSAGRKHNRRVEIVAKGVMNK